LDANFFSAVLCLFLPVAVVAWWKKSPARWFVILGAAIFFFASRGAWVSLGVTALLAPAFIFPKKSQRVLWLVLACILLVGGGLLLNHLTPTVPPASHLGRLESIGDTQKDFSNRERLMRWTCAWRMALDRPITGFGPARFAPTFKFYLQDWEEVERIAYWNGWRFGAHSDVLTQLAEAGFVGAGLFVLMIAGLGRACLRRYFQESAYRLQRMGLLLGLVTWLVHGAFNDLLDSNFILITIFFYFGLLLPPTQEKPSEKPSLVA